jgi:hypothetical protein
MECSIQVARISSSLARQNAKDMWYTPTRAIPFVRIGSVDLCSLAFDRTVRDLLSFPVALLGQLSLRFEEVKLGIDYAARMLSKDGKNRQSFSLHLRNISAHKKL